MRILFAFILISITALSQKVDTLKIPGSQAAKLNDVEKQLKEMESIIQKFNALQTIKAQLIESAFDYNEITIPEKKEYVNGVILYIKDEKKK
jgi:hypothetical protein